MVSIETWYPRRFYTRPRRRWRASTRPYLNTYQKRQYLAPLDCLKGTFGINYLSKCSVVLRHWHELVERIYRHYPQVGSVTSLPTAFLCHIPNITIPIDQRKYQVQFDGRLIKSFSAGSMNRQDISSGYEPSLPHRNITIHSLAYILSIQSHYLEVYQQIQTYPFGIDSKRKRMYVQWKEKMDISTYKVTGWAN